MLTNNDKIEILNLINEVLHNCVPTRVDDMENPYFEEAVNQNNLMYEINAKIDDLVNEKLRGVNANG